MKNWSGPLIQSRSCTPPSGLSLCLTVPWTHWMIQNTTSHQHCPSLRTSRFCISTFCRNCLTPFNGWRGTKQTYAQLAKVTLAQIIVFNRRQRLQFCSRQAWWMLCHYLSVKEQNVMSVPHMFSCLQDPNQWATTEDRTVCVFMQASVERSTLNISDQHSSGNMLPRSHKSLT